MNSTRPLPSVPRKRHGWLTLMPSRQDDSLYRYGCIYGMQGNSQDTSSVNQTEIKTKRKAKMTTENRDNFIKKFHNPLFGAEVYSATRVQAGLSRVFSRAEQKAFNRIANRGPSEDVDDLLVAYRLIGGKVASESRKRLTFLLYGEVKSEVKNGGIFHYIEHRTDKELKAAWTAKKDLMDRVKLLGENFAYVTKNSDKVEALLKAYTKLSEEDQTAFLRKLSDLTNK